MNALTKQQKLAVLWRNTGPYHHARCRALAKDFDLCVIELVAHSNVHQWEVNHQADLDGFRLLSLFAHDRDITNKVCVVYRLLLALHRERPEILLIPSYSPYWAIVMLIYGKLTGCQSVLMTESNKHDKARSPLAEWIKRILVRFYDCGIVGGTSSRDYLTELGMPPSRIRDGYDCVDVAYYQRVAIDTHAAADSVRLQLGIPHQFFLCSARLAEDKNHELLLRAFAAFKATQEGRDYHLILCGNGPLRQELEILVSDLSIPDVEFRGFVQARDLAKLYTLSRALILPSTSEAWGLVINEALACGVPVLASDIAGAAIELIKDGVNGFVFSPKSANSIADCMRKIACVSDSSYKSMRDEAHSSGKRFTPEYFCSNVKHIVSS